MSAAADSAEARIRLYDRLNRRNRFIGFLRLFVPIVGGLAIVLFIVQIAASRFSDGLEVGPIRIDRDTVGFQNPSYTGVTSNGMSYQVQAESAVTPIGTSSAVELSDANMVLTDPNRPETTANAAEATMNLEANQVYSPGPVFIEDTRGTRAELQDATLFWESQAFVAEGPVHVDYYNGIVIDAEAMRYDGEAETWHFEKVVVQIPAELKE